MNGCIHCMMLMPAWESACKSPKMKNCNVNIAAVEYSKMELMPPSMHISAFPTIMVYEDGKKIAAFDGARTPENLIAFFEHFESTSETKEKAKRASGKKTSAKKTATSASKPKSRSSAK